MTILPKKKSAQQSRNDTETVADQSSQQGGHQSQAAEGIANRERLFIPPGGNSPPRWVPSTSRVEDKRPVSSASRFDDDEDFGPSKSKRRLRGSPLRSFRQKHRERGSSSPIIPVVAPSISVPPAPSPPPGPSDTSSSPKSEDKNGYNSGDEYGPLQFDQTEEEWLEKERRFEKKMRKRGLLIKIMNPDGACLFRSVADQVYGDQEMHGTVRHHCMDYIAANSDYYRQWLTEDLQSYLKRKRRDTVQGNHVEIQAMSEMYNRPIEVFCYSSDPINIFQGNQQSKEINPAIRLSYHRGVHYNSLVDPLKATIGVGLGLPEHVPGSADRSLLGDAINQSEETEIERTMMEDKVKATDWEATNEAIEEHIARESYLEWLRDNERRSKQSQRTTTLKSPDIRSPRHRGESSTRPPSAPLEVSLGLRNSPKSSNTEKKSFCLSPQPGHSRDQLPSTSKGADWLGDFKLAETSSFLNQLPSDILGMSDWDDADVIAKVLAESQADYLNSLKHRACSSAGSSDSEH